MAEGDGNGWRESVLPWLGSKGHVVVVVAGGALGGILAAPVQILIRGGGKLTEFEVPPLGWDVWVWFTIFGALAAFLSVYVIANAKRDNWLHLAGLALAGGLAFPAVFADTVDQQTLQGTRELRAAQTAALEGDTQANVETAEIIATSAIDKLDAQALSTKDKQLLSDDVTDVVRQLSTKGEPEANEAAARIVTAAKAKGIRVDTAAISATPPVQP